MDVVRRNIHELGGTIELDSTLHQGTQLTIRLPLTLAILDGQLFRLGDQTYVLPLISVVESLVPSARRLSNIAGGAEVYRLRDAFIPLLRLSDLYGLPGDGRRFEDSLMIVTEGSQGPVGLLVDELLGQQQVVIKSLERNFDRVDGVAGATILGNGHVALIADVPGLLRLHASRPTPRRASGQDCAA
jgi:two-component system chemotaxis sensor kinase CheA